MSIRCCLLDVLLLWVGAAGGPLVVKQRPQPLQSRAPEVLVEAEPAAHFGERFGGDSVAYRSEGSYQITSRSLAGTVHQVATSAPGASRAYTLHDSAGNMTVANRQRVQYKSKTQGCVAPRAGGNHIYAVDGMIVGCTIRQRTWQRRSMRLAVLPVNSRSGAA